MGMRRVMTRRNKRGTSCGARTSLLTRGVAINCTKVKFTCPRPMMDLTVNAVFGSMSTSDSYAGWWRAGAEARHLAMQPFHHQQPVTKKPLARLVTCGAVTEVYKDHATCVITSFSRPWPCSNACCFDFQALFWG